MILGDTHFRRLGDTQFEVFTWNTLGVITYMLRVNGRLMGFIDEPTIEACERKMLEYML